MPPELIDAFSSTLEESLTCDVLLQVIDSSDPHLVDRIQVTNDILDRIGASQPRWFVFNQIDRSSSSQLKKLKKDYKHLKPIFVSAKTGEGVDELKEKILTVSN